MLTHDFRAFPFAIFRSSRLPELAGIFTFRIIGTSDKGAETTAAQRQFSVIAKRAGTRIAAVPLVGKQHGFKKFIEFGGDIRRILLHDLGGLGLEVQPKGFKDLLPSITTGAELIKSVLHDSRRHQTYNTRRKQQ